MSNLAQSDLMNMLMGSLSDPETKDKLMGIVSQMGKSDEKSESDESPRLPLENDFMNPLMIAKIKGLLDNFNRMDDNRIVLLNSIRPYMKSGRGKGIDTAIKFIQLMNFTSGFKKEK